LVVLTIHGKKRFEVLAVVLLRIQVFWNVTLCHWVSASHPFRKLCCYHLQRYSVHAFFMDWLPLKMKVTSSSKLQEPLTQRQSVTHPQYMTAYKLRTSFF
jgi:hypothetical protein